VENADDFDEVAATTDQLLVPRMVEAVKTAMEAQSVVVPGTTAAATVLPRLARSLRSVHEQRAEVAAQVEGILDGLPLPQALTMMPGIGVRNAARILLEIGDINEFIPPTPGRLRWPGPGHQTLRLLHQRTSTYPRVAKRPSIAPCSTLRSPPPLTDPVSRAYCDKK
jgi:hypothetical protein